MTSNRMDELFSRLEQSSSTYASRATQLSDAILAFEERLHSVMKGKFAASVTHENPQIGFHLAYDRVDGQWRLCFAVGKPGATWRPLQESAVKYKILAVGLFEGLLKQILGMQEAQTEKLHSALDGISAFLNVEPRQEGGSDDTSVVPQFSS